MDDGGGSGSGVDRAGASNSTHHTTPVGHMTLKGSLLFVTNHTRSHRDDGYNICKEYCPLWAQWLGF